MERSEKDRRAGGMTGLAHEMIENLCARPFLWIAMGLLQLLCVVVFTDSSLFHAVELSGGMRLPLNIVFLLVVIVVVMGVALLARFSRRDIAFLRWSPFAVSAVTGIGALLSSFGALQWTPSAATAALGLIVAGGALVGMGVASITVEVCAVLGKVGARLTFLYGAAGTLINVLLITIFHNCGAYGQTLVFVVVGLSLPLISAQARRGFANASLGIATPAFDQRVPWRLTVTAFFQGLSFGAVYYAFPLELATVGMFALDMLGFLLAAVCLIISVALLSVNYNRLIYQICFVAIAVSYGLLAVVGPAFEFSLVLKNAGYTLLDMTIIALSAYLVRERKASVLLVALWPSFAMLSGHLIGEVGVLAASAMGIAGAQVFTTVAIVLLIAALLLSNSQNMRTGWGLVRAGEEERSRASVTLACETLAARYGLTKRETEILGLLAAGKTKTAIASRLVISTDTAKTHIANIYRKMDVHSQQVLMEMVEKVEGQLG